jgi:hypothetical protein
MTMSDKPTPEGRIKLPPVDPRPPEIALGEALADAYSDDLVGIDVPDSLRWTMVDVFRRAARLLKQRGQRVGVYALWRLTGKRNPARVQSGRLGGSQAYRTIENEHEREIRKRARAAMGGMAVFTKDGRNPSTYGKLLRQNRTRKAKGLPPLDLSG